MPHVMTELEGWGDLNTLGSSQFCHEPQDLLFSLLSFGLPLVHLLFVMVQFFHFETRLFTLLEACELLLILLDSQEVALSLR